MRILRTTIALIAIVVLAGVAPARAEWRTHFDARYAMQIDYPSELFATVEENANGVTMVGPDVRLEMSAMQVPGLTTAVQLRDLVAQTEGYENVTYSPGGNRWLVVSGYRGGDIFYEKFFLSSGIVRGFSMQYPTAMRHRYDPVVERMEDSFRVWPRG